MNNKNKFLKSVYVLGSLLVVAALLLTGCDGTISLQGSASPNDEGGIDISGGTTQQDTASGGTGMNQTTMILIAVGVALFILILVIVTRGQSRGEPRS
jgi:hypothetical protein